MYSNIIFLVIYRFWDYKVIKNQAGQIIHSLIAYLHVTGSNLYNSLAVVDYQKFMLFQ